MDEKPTFSLERRAKLEPAAPAIVIPLGDTLPRILKIGPTGGHPDVDETPHRSKDETAKTILGKLEIAGLDEIDMILIPGLHPGDSPTTYEIVQGGSFQDLKTAEEVRRLRQAQLPTVSGISRGHSTAGLFIFLFFYGPGKTPK